MQNIFSEETKLLLYMQTHLALMKDKNFCKIWKREWTHMKKTGIHLPLSKSDLISSFKEA